MKMFPMTRMMMMLVALVLPMMMLTTAGFRHRSPGVFHFHMDHGNPHDSLRPLPKKPHTDRGYLMNCGKGGGFFDVSWFPEELTPADRIHFYANFTAPADLSAVRVVGDVMYEGNHMLSINRRYQCTDLALELSNLFPREGIHIPCPIHKGEHFTGSFLFADTEQLIGFDGDYDVKATILTDQGKELMCIRIKLTILPFDV